MKNLVLVLFITIFLNSCNSGEISRATKILQTHEYLQRWNLRSLSYFHLTGVSTFQIHALEYIQRHKIREMVLMHDDIFPHLNRNIPIFIVENYSNISAEDGSYITYEVIIKIGFSGDLVYKGTYFPLKKGVILNDKPKIIFEKTAEKISRSDCIKIATARNIKDENDGVYISFSAVLDL